MNIPLPLILALLNNNRGSQKGSSGIAQISSLVGPLLGNMMPGSGTIHNTNGIGNLSNVASMLGGNGGARINKLANLINVVTVARAPIVPMAQNTSPQNLMSLFGGGGSRNLLETALLKPGISSLMNSISSSKNGNQGQAGSMMDKVNSMLSGMDSEKKQELLNMAQNMMQSMK